MLEPLTLLMATGAPGAGAGTASGLGGGISMGPVVLRLMGSMTVVFLLIFVVIYLFRRYGRNLSPQMAMSGHITILGSFSLEAKKRIYLVRVFDRVILMGSGPNGLAALAEFDRNDVEERLKATDSNPRPVDDFRRMIRKLTANLQSLKGVEVS